MTKNQTLQETASAMVSDGRGILAVDESTGTCTRRFTDLGIESTEDSRRDYRQMMFTTPSAGQYVSGAIMYDETIRQVTKDGRRLAEILSEAGILPGIKVDTGARPLANAPGETVTEGLDRLRERLAEYREMGARFTKWRAVIRIGPSMPSRLCIDANAHALARYASLAQEAGLVPIVEPEVLMNGEHDISRCQEVTEEVLRAVFAHLVAQRCQLEAMVLKPNMVTPGNECDRRTGSNQVAELTLQSLRRCVPSAVPGIAFLSGGQTGEEACMNLNAMTSRGGLPWQLTYSFGRALQYPAIEIWGGKPDNIPAAQSAFVHRLRMSSLARHGRYSPEMEREFVPAH